MGVWGWKRGMIYDEDKNNPSRTESPVCAECNCFRGSKDADEKFHYYECMAAGYGRTVFNFTQVLFGTSECS